MKLYGIDFKNSFEKHDQTILLEVIDHEKKEKLTKFRHVQDKVRGLYAELLTRYVLINTYQLENSDISFAKNAFGKPVLREHEHIHFNYSHSGDWVVCGFDKNPVGVDVEQVKEMDVETVLSAFSAYEEAFIHQTDPQKRLDEFYKLWTFKESYTKAIGEGLSKDLKSFDIQLDERSSVIRCEGWYLKNYDLAKNYKLAVASKTSDFTDAVVKLPAEYIADFFIA